MLLLGNSDALRILEESIGKPVFVRDRGSDAVQFDALILSVDTSSDFVHVNHRTTNGDEGTFGFFSSKATFFQSPRSVTVSEPGAGELEILTS